MTHSLAHPVDPSPVTKDLFMNQRLLLLLTAIAALCAWTVAMWEETTFLRLALGSVTFALIYLAALTLVLLVSCTKSESATPSTAVAPEAPPTPTQPSHCRWC